MAAVPLKQYIEGLIAPIITAFSTTLAQIIPSFEQTANKGEPNGYAELDSTGRVPYSELPTALAGAMAYAGTWNATTNTPALTNTPPGSGTYYVVATAGTTSIVTRVGTVATWNAGDLIISDGTYWDKVDGSALSFAALSDVLLTNLQSGDVLSYNGSKWVNGRPQYIISVYFYGQPSANQEMFAHGFADAVTIPANFGETRSGASSTIELVGAAAQNQLTLTLMQCLAASNPTVGANWVTIGTAIFAAGGYEATLTTNNGTSVAFAQNDRLLIVGGSPSDVNAANFRMTIAADR